LKVFITSFRVSTGNLRAILKCRNGDQPAFTFLPPMPQRISGEGLYNRRYAVTMTLLGATLAFSKFADFRAPHPLSQSLTTIPNNIAGWRFAADVPVDAEVLSTLAATSVVSRSYERAGAQLSLFVAYYASQQGGGALHSPNNCLPGNGWTIQKSRTVPIAVDGQSVDINHFTISSQDSDLALFYWYQSRKRIFTNEYAGKVLLFRDALFEGDSSGSMARIIVENKPEAIQQALAFAPELVKSLRRCFGTPQLASL
jgi:EpsI family protein